MLHVFPTFDLGGSQRRTVDLMNAFKTEERHIVVSIDGRRGAAAKLDPDVRIEFRECRVRPSRGPALDNWRRLRRLLDETQPDLLLSYNFGAIEAALANRLFPLCRHIHFEDGFGPEEADGQQLPRRVWLRRLALSGNSIVIVPSRTLERIALEVWRLKPDRVCYIPNGIDIERFARAKPYPRLRQSDEECLIGSIGILRPEKRFDRLLRVFAGLEAPHPVRLVIAGDGPERTKLEGLAREMQIGDRVTFTGFVDAPEAIMAALDVFALTSDTEQMPYSVIEAMAAGLAIVATNVGDVEGMLPETSRTFVGDKRDEAGLAVRFRKLICNKSLRSEQARGNFDHARSNFGIDRMIDAYRNIFAVRAQL